MSHGGTASYEHEDELPELVVAAVREAQRLAFEISSRPEHGRLLQVRCPPLPIVVLACENR